MQVCSCRCFRNIHTSLRCFPPRTEGTLYDIIPSPTTMLCKDHQYPLFVEGSQVSQVCLVTPTFRSRAQSMCSAGALYSLGYTGSSVRCVSWSQHQPGCPAFSIATLRASEESSEGNRASVLYVDPICWVPQESSLEKPQALTLSSTFNAGQGIPSLKVVSISYQHKGWGEEISAFK